MALSGFILLDKVAGETSFKALFPLKRVFCTKRVGHAGTLDLRASGLIIAATGRATRLLPYVEAKDKCYTFRLHLGYETDTVEWDGDVVEQDESCHPGAEGYTTLGTESLSGSYPLCGDRIQAIDRAALDGIEQGCGTVLVPSHADDPVGSQDVADTQGQSRLGGIVGLEGLGHACARLVAQQHQAAGAVA